MTSWRKLSLVFCSALVFAQQQQPRVVQPGIPGMIQPTAYLIPDGQYAIGGGPDWLAMGEDMVWTNAKGQDFVARMDPRTNEVVARVPMKKPCSGLVVAAGTLWAPSCEENVIYRIDVTTNKVIAKAPVGPANTEGGIAFGAGSAWMPSDPTGVVSRIDPATNTVIAKIKVAPGSFTAIYGFGLVWVSSTEKNLVSVIDPATNEVIKEIATDAAPRFMAAGEGAVWTLNQTKGTITKIDPYLQKVVATIEAGVPGTGGDIAAGEGKVWVTARTIPVTAIDPVTHKVVAQFAGPGGDALRVGHGYLWLSNGRWQSTWRMLPSRIMETATNWTSRAQKADLDGDGNPDLLVEDLITWIPGEPTTFRVKALTPSIGDKFTLNASLNGKASEVPFTKSGEEYTATFTGTDPRWIHYSVCITGKQACSADNVVASPTTTAAYAKKTARLVPDTFLLPVMPQIKDYKWNILEPAILDQDYQALLDRAGNAGPIKITKLEDYGELKRHQWEFRNQSAYSWGILTPDKKTELGCVYINPSKKEGYDAMVRIWVTKQGADLGLEPILESSVREWVKTTWPFKKVAYPGRDIAMPEWNKLPDASE